MVRIDWTRSALQSSQSLQVMINWCRCHNFTFFQDYTLYKKQVLGHLELALPPGSLFLFWLFSIDSKLIQFVIDDKRSDKYNPGALRGSSLPRSWRHLRGSQVRFPDPLPEPVELKRQLNHLSLNLRGSCRAWTTFTQLLGIRCFPAGFSHLTGNVNLKISMSLSPPHFSSEILSMSTFRP